MWGIISPQQKRNFLTNRNYVEVKNFIKIKNFKKDTQSFLT